MEKNKKYVVAGYKVENDGYRLRVTLPNGDEVVGLEYKHNHPVFEQIIEKILEDNY